MLTLISLKWTLGAYTTINKSKTKSMHPTQNQKQIMHERNKLFMLQTGRKSH